LQSKSFTPQFELGRHRSDTLNLNSEKLETGRLDPRLVARAADLLTRTDGSLAGDVAAGRAVSMGAVGGLLGGFGGTAPMVPLNMPHAPGPSGYSRYREMTLEEMLLENRVVFLVGDINHVSASRVIMQMLYLQSVKRDGDINFYINSPGGVVDDTLAMYDIMKFLNCDVATYCLGRAESGGALAFMAGAKGKRFILPHAKVMIHQPFGGVTGQASDIQIQAEEILKTKDTLIQIMADCTGQTVDRVREDSERDRYFLAKEAVAYGLCDEVIGLPDAKAKK
jgi:ATP-dependent Clp protease, protease subunit